MKPQPFVVYVGSALVAMTMVAGILCADALPASARTKVTVASWWSFETGSSLDRLKTAFEKANPDIQIEYIQIPASEYYTKVLTMIASGQSPDVAMLGMDKLAPWVDRNALTNLEPFIQRTGFNLNAYFPAVIEAVRYADGIYGLPRDITSNVLAYNKRLFDEAGVPYPTGDWNVEDFLEAAQRLTKKTSVGTDVFGYAYDTFADGWYDWLLLNNATFLNKEGNRSALHEPAAVEALQFLVDLRTKYGVSPTTAQAKAFTYASSAFRIGKAAMYFTSVGWAQSFNTNPDLDWDVAPLPEWKRKATRVWVNFWTMPRGSKNPEAAWRVISFFSGPEGQRIAGETRMGIPAIEAVAYSEAFAASPERPEHREVFLTSMAVGEPFPMFPQWAEFYDVVARELDLVWDGQRDVESAVLAIDRQTRSLFR